MPSYRRVLSVAAFLFLLIAGGRNAWPQQEVLVPEGGRLEAVDEAGNVLGPCPLEHTEVEVAVSGIFSRITLTQTYHNPLDRKIEAVYTFPLSHRAAVDSMVMIIDDRIVEAEIRERDEARRVYEAARDAGYVASLLEQERPNIFTQSVANIEPGAKVLIELSYVETLESVDGRWQFDFPMVVGPRYIPGSTTVSPALVPEKLEPRHGIILLGPARLELSAAGEVGDLGTLQSGKLQTLLTAAQSIEHPGEEWWSRGDGIEHVVAPTVWYRFEAEYCDGSRESGTLHTDGTGEVNRRWFFTDPEKIKEMAPVSQRTRPRCPTRAALRPRRCALVSAQATTYRSRCTSTAADRASPMFALSCMISGSPRRSCVMTGCPGKS